MFRARLLSLQTRKKHAAKKDAAEGHVAKTDAAKTDAADKRAADELHRPFLLVTLGTKRKTFQLFEQRAHRLLPFFHKAGLDLIISGWRVHGDTIHITNLWHMKDANTLISAELDLVDEPDYLLLDQMLVNEQKNIVIPVTDTQPLLDAKTIHDEQHKVLVSKLAKASIAEREQLLRQTAPGFVYAVVTYDLETEDLAEFRARFEAGIDTFRRLTQWEFGVAFLGVTASDDRVTQFWKVPATMAAYTEDFLSRAPWDDLPEKPPHVEILYPSSFDSIMPIPALAGTDLLA